MNRKFRFLSIFMAALFILMCCSCQSSPSSGGATSSATPSSTPSAGVQPESRAAAVDPCSKFSAADAQAIIGVPMKLSPGHGAIVCMYEEASPMPGTDTARVSLRLSVRKSAEEEDRAWNNTKVIRRLKSGEKNIVQLNGIGDEAWFDGHIEKGKVDTGGVLARKGKSDFALESATLGYRASVEQIKTIARRIAAELE